MYPTANFEVLLLDEHGAYVPGSRRVGHNVFTDVGREWLKQLVVWDSFGPDAALDTRRFRWIGVGSGQWAELTSVDVLHTPLSITTGPDVYLKPLGTRTEPTNFSTKFATSFTGASSDLDHHGASVDVSESGIFVDVHDGIGTLLDPTIATNAPVAYKSFAPLTKLAAQTLIVNWEFRF